MNSIIAFLFRQQIESNDKSKASLTSEMPPAYGHSIPPAYEREDDAEAPPLRLSRHFQQHTDEKTFATLGESVNSSDIGNAGSMGIQNSNEKAVAVYRPRPTTNRRVSSSAMGGLIIESRKTAAPAPLGVHGRVAAAGSFSRGLHLKNKEAPLNGPEAYRRKISTRIYRVTDEFISRCQNLVDHVFTNDPLCQYLRGLTITDKESSAIMQKYYKKSQQLALRRAAVKGDITLRAAIISSDTVTGGSASSASHQVIQEIEACAGFALWRVSPENSYSWQLFLFDLKTAHKRLIAMLDELFWGLKNGNLYSFEYHIPGGVVDENRYSVYTRSREKIVKKLLKGRRYLTIKNLGVLAEFRNEGIGSQLLQYGLDMADTQNLPIYVETSSLKFLKFCEKFRFKLVHELRLLDLQQGSFNIRNRMAPTKLDAESGAKRRDEVLASTVATDQSSNAPEDKGRNASLNIPRTCAVYCMIREPAVKKLAPPPVLPETLGADSSDAKME
ncbi:hypothetical protein V1520DRAFT_153564 [Lipomyces starkeyi]|uniref:N-acetyltransferase domain-containing protein n=1 Tax=Lipomyces starkeyi NRRL Y-11557 TaxID=675824 RepID=A0A1E3Q0R1_LIPST|nr:hypothetical protein LIPSTDRAFT_172376 [Lipomyces starkeyi NRRL Y-11557]